MYPKVFYWSLKQQDTEEKTLWVTFFGPTSRRGSYKITVASLSVCPSVRLSVRLSVRQFGIFHRNGSLVFSDFLHNGS